MAREKGLRAALLALLLLPTPALADEVGPLNALVLSLEQALDAGDGAAVLDAARTAARDQPGRAPDVAATTTLLAPWMAADAVAAVLAALPPEDRARQAPPVLAAVLAAARGREGARLLAAERTAAPDADPALLDDLVRRMAGASVDGVTADLPAVGAAPDPVLRSALAEAREASVAGRLRLEDARLRRWRAAGARAPAPSTAGAMPAPASTSLDLPGEPRLELRYLAPPRLPDPTNRPSPS